MRNLSVEIIPDSVSAVSQSHDGSYKFTVTAKIDMQRVSDLLCSAMEGGSNYWYIIMDYVEPTGEIFRSQPDLGGVFKHLDYPLSPGGAVMIGDTEDPDRAPIRLDLQAIMDGVTLMANKYPKHFADWLNQHDDATTGDVFLQCCVFGEVIYG